MCQNNVARNLQIDMKFVKAVVELVEYVIATLLIS